MEAYYFNRQKEKVFFNTDDKKRNLYFGCGFQDDNDKSKLFLSHFMEGTCLSCVYSAKTNFPIYNKFDSENGKESYQIDFNFVKLITSHHLEI
jgi:hypothetical protein